MSDDHVTRQFDRRNTGWNPDGTPLAAGTAVNDIDGCPVTEAWRYDTGGKVRSSPAVVGDTAYVGSYDGRVHALDTDRGTRTWAADLDGGIVVSSPAVRDGTVYVGSYDDFGRSDRTIHALDARTGDVRWSIPAYRGTEASPTVSGDTVFVGGHTGPFYALDADTGAVQWERDIEGTRRAAAVTDDGVFVAAPEVLYGLDRRDGGERWRLDLPVTTAPAVLDGTVYVGTGDGELVAVDADSGERVWHTGIWEPGVVEPPYRREGMRPIDAWRGTYVSPAVTRETVVGTVHNVVYGLDVHSGEIRWRADLRCGWVGTPLVVRDVLYFGTQAGTVYALDLATGTVRWAYEGLPVSRSSPAVVDGALYVGSTDGHLYSLREATTRPDERDRRDT